MSVERQEQKPDAREEQVQASVTPLEECGDLAEKCVLPSEEAPTAPPASESEKEAELPSNAEKADTEATEPPSSPLGGETELAEIIHFPISPRRFWNVMLKKKLKEFIRPKQKKQRKQKKKHTPPPPPPDTPPRELAARYAKGLSGLQLRCGLAFCFTTFLLYLTLMDAKIVPVPPMLDAFSKRGWISVVVLAAVLILSWEAVCSGLRALFKLKPNMQTISTLACLATIADTMTLLITALRSQTMPFCAPAALCLSFHLWGMARIQAMRRLSCRTASATAQPYLVARDRERRDGTDVFGKYTAVPRGFGSQIQAPDGAEQRLSRYIPSVFWGCVLLSLLATVAHHQPSLFFWSLSATCTATAALGGTLCFALPAYPLTKRLARDGAALAGWSGIETARKDSGLLLTDVDLFPPASVSLRDMETFQGYSEETVISVTATLIRASGCGLDHLFQKLGREWDGMYLRAEEFQVHETGVSATIQGAKILVGNLEFLSLYGISMPYTVPSRGMVFCAIDGALAGLFSLNYALHRSVAPTLEMLEANYIRPVLATRDFNLAPAFLRKRFHLPVGKLTYPTVEERMALSDQERPHEERMLAVLCREGIAPFATAVIGAPRIARAVRMNTLFTGAGAIIGMLLAFYLSSFAALSALSALSMTAFLLLWFLPILLVSGWVKQF